MKEYKRGIFVGKFFPLHFGHISTINMLSSVCEKTYVIFYNNKISEEKIKEQFGYDYDVDLRISDAKELFKNNDNIDFIRFDVPDNIIFPNDFKKLKAMVESIVGGEIDIQIFGCEEKDIYEPYKYAKHSMLGAIYNVEDKESNIVSLHATLIREDYNYYKKHLPSRIQRTIDSIRGKKL